MRGPDSDSGNGGNGNGRGGKNNFLSYINRKGSKGLSVYSKEDIINELALRSAASNPFPLDVFHDKIKPYISVLIKEYDVPPSFIGLSLLCAYSTAIGTSYVVSTNGYDKMYLSVWACLLGISSSGKSVALGHIFSPLQNIQDSFDEEWDTTTNLMTDQQILKERLKTVIFRDAHVPTLVRYVLPDNPKGIGKYSDELLEWINGMNQLSKNGTGTDEQFWLSTWNCAPFNAIRSGKQKYVLKRPFVNVYGGTQWKTIWKFFAKDRDATGFIFRLLFATAEHDKIANVRSTSQMPLELSGRHAKSLEVLYNWLKVDDQVDKPRICVLTTEARKLFDMYSEENIHRINAIEDLDQRNIEAGIFGKTKEYALRFSAILVLSEIALTANFPYEYDSWHRDSTFKPEVAVTVEVMERAIRLANYFYASAVNVYSHVAQTITAPPDVLYAAVMFKNGKSLRDMAEFFYHSTTDASKQKMSRQLKKWMAEYPKIFGAVNK